MLGLGLVVSVRVRISVIVCIWPRSRVKLSVTFRGKFSVSFWVSVRFMVIVRVNPTVQLGFCLGLSLC